MKKIACVLNLIMLSLLIGVSSIDASETGYINGPDTIQKEQYSVLTLSDILNLYTSNVGGVSIQRDGYTGNGSILGTYEIDLYSNSGSNIVEKTIKVEVIKSIGYSVRAVTNRRDIHINKSVKLLPFEIAYVHSKVGLIDLNSTSQMSILSDTYTENSSSPGTYLFEYRIMDATGLDMVVSSTITVYESDRIESPIILVPKEPTFLDNLMKVLNWVLMVLGLVVIGFIVFKTWKKVMK